MIPLLKSPPETLANSLFRIREKEIVVDSASQERLPGLQDLPRRLCAVSTRERPHKKCGKATERGVCTSFANGPIHTFLNVSNRTIEEL